MLKLILLCGVESLQLQEIANQDSPEKTKYRYLWPELIGGVPIGQRALINRIQLVVQEAAKRDCITIICTQSDLVIDAIRLEIARGSIRHDYVEIQWFGHERDNAVIIRPDQHGRLHSWPTGFSDTRDVLLSELLMYTGPAPTYVPLTEELVAECYKRNDGHVIKTIKELRTLTNLGLKETKEAFDAHKEKVSPPPEKKDDEFTGESMDCWDADE